MEMIFRQDNKEFRAVSIKRDDRNHGKKAFKQIYAFCRWKRNVKFLVYEESQVTGAVLSLCHFDDGMDEYILYAIYTAIEAK